MNTNLFLFERTKNKKIYSSICASSRCVKNVRLVAYILYSLRGYICYYIFFYFSVCLLQK